MRHKVADLEGKNLDAAVAMAEGWRRGNWGLDGFRPNAPGWTRPGKVAVGERTEDTEVYELEPWPWSTDWNYGGPIIEREHITIAAVPAGEMAPLEWMATLNYSEAGCERTRMFDASLLVAAMRAYVASKFGEEIEL